MSAITVSAARAEASARIRAELEYAAGNKLLSKKEMALVASPWLREIADGVRAGKPAGSRVTSAEVIAAAEAALDAVWSCHVGESARDKKLWSRGEIADLAKSHPALGQFTSDIYATLRTVAPLKPDPTGPNLETTIDHISTYWGDENIMSGTARIEAFGFDRGADSAELQDLAEEELVTFYEDRYTYDPMSFPAGASIETTTQPMREALKVLRDDISEGFRYSPNYIREDYGDYEELPWAGASDLTKAEMDAVASALGGESNVRVVTARSEFIDSDGDEQIAAVHLIVNPSTGRGARVGILYNPNAL